MRDLGTYIHEQYESEDMTENIQTTLPESSLLEQFDAADRTVLSSFGEFLTYEPDAVLITEGGDQDFLYLVVDGTLHASTQRESGRNLLGRINAGEWFGEINVIDPGTASATVIARTYTCVWRISRSGIEKYINEYPLHGAQILLSISTQLAKRLRGVNERWGVKNDLELYTV